MLPNAAVRASLPPVDDPLAALLSQWWYYSIELAPGVVTPGQGHLNVALTRELLAGCDITARKCLDCGVMEGMISTLMARRGATVTAVDAWNNTEKINAVRKAYGVSFDYQSGVGSLDLFERVEAIRHHQATAASAFHPTISQSVDRSSLYYDLIVMSGLMYHTWSPLHLLGSARTLLRTGGLFILETAFLHSPQAHMTFNFNGQGYLYEHWSNTWFLSDTLLDHLLRLFHFRPIDCVHTYLPGSNEQAHRIAIVCRAIDEPLADPSEQAMVAMTHNFEFPSLLRRVKVHDAPTDEVTYLQKPRGNIDRSSTASCNLYDSVQNTPPFEMTPEQAILRLSDSV